MRELSLIVVFFITLFSTSSDSPHGDSLTISCDDCHTSQGWEINRKDITFNHNITRFELVGLHQDVNCDACHPTLVFSDAKTECVACHTDMHQQTVGFDCARCHNSNSWLVDNINEIHQQSRFPLLGAHITADCYDCHQSASLLTFEPLGVECVDCHRDEYFATTDPNHVESNFSTECMDCHQMNAFAWTGADFTHAFFPLTLGHDISNCTECHTDGNDYSTLSPNCFSCHQDDFLVTTNPNHQQADLSTNCTECHTTNPGWKPADFRQHDNLYFPIYSGEHNGEWVSCTDCHTTPSNYSLFTCTDCHEHSQSEMDDEHNGVSGYLYNSNACFECHPTGSEDGAFNHDASAFPLTGAHITTDCASCHTDGYAGTPTVCSECHTPDFNQATNPNHVEIGLTNDCETCHTTNPGWQPASFDVHNDYYVLAGAHTTIDCNSCHETQYSGTPNTCIGCHLDDYNQTTDPQHAIAQFSTDCLICHTENAWEPSTFDHDNQYFPIYSGEHQGEWNSCIECHTTSSNYALFSCIDCHEHNQPDMDDEHNDVTGYVYNSNACFDCHPQGDDKHSYKTFKPKTIR
jgi:hypothetical protein